MVSSRFITSLESPVHPSWETFLDPQVVDELIRIETQIAGSEKEFFPQPSRVLRFLGLPPESIRVVILGQDPYPQPSAATGRAFEVGTLRQWSETFSNVSLKNIIRSICQAYTGQALRYSQIISQPPGEFRILPPDRLFSSWERQGVLLLNTSFTVEAGRPGSHSRIWSSFTSHLLRFLSASLPRAVWLLWGNHARQVTKDLQLTRKIISQHPMMCWDGPRRDDDFLFGKINPFRETMDLVDWRGKTYEFPASEKAYQERFPF
jgi:uracil-DNA glycosylase